MSHFSNVLSLTAKYLGISEPEPTKRDPYYRANTWVVQRYNGGEWKDFGVARYGNKEFAVSKLVDCQTMWPDSEFRVYPSPK